LYRSSSSRRYLFFLFAFFLISERCENRSERRDEDGLAWRRRVEKLEKKTFFIQVHASRLSSSSSSLSFLCRRGLKEEMRTAWRRKLEQLKRKAFFHSNSCQELGFEERFSV
jgi:hypothetical protein